MKKLGKEKLSNDLKNTLKEKEKIQENYNKINKEHIKIIEELQSYKEIKEKHMNEITQIKEQIHNLDKHIAQIQIEKNNFEESYLKEKNENEKMSNILEEKYKELSTYEIDKNINKIKIEDLEKDKENILLTKNEEINNLKEEYKMVQQHLEDTNVLYEKQKLAIDTITKEKK